MSNAGSASKQTRSNDPSTATATSAIMGSGISYHWLNPTVADILHDKNILSLYQAVKEIKAASNPQLTGQMFFALAHALDSDVHFVKPPSAKHILFRQDNSQFYAVNLAAATGSEESSGFAFGPPSGPVHHQAGMHNQLPHHHTQQQQLHSAHPVGGIPLDLSQYGSVSAQLPTQARVDADGTVTYFSAPSSGVIGGKRKADMEDKDGKRGRKSQQKEKDYATKRQELINDLLNISESDLANHSSTLPNDIKLMIQSADLPTGSITHSSSSMPPLQRLAQYANQRPHMDCDYAPKNSGVYYNYEYYMLYLAFREVERERVAAANAAANDAIGISSNNNSIGGGPPSSSQVSSAPSSSSSATAVAGTSDSSIDTHDNESQQVDMNNSNDISDKDTKPIVLHRVEIEKLLVHTNWEAFRRRLTIGERICHLTRALGKGYLLLSKEISGRKLLHGFNTAEWADFIRDFSRPDNREITYKLRDLLARDQWFQLSTHHQSIVLGQQQQIGSVHTLNVVAVAAVQAQAQVQAQASQQNDGEGMINQLSTLTGLGGSAQGGIGNGFGRF